MDSAPLREHRRPRAPDGVPANNFGAESAAKKGEEAIFEGLKANQPSLPVITGSEPQKKSDLFVLVRKMKVKLKVTLKSSASSLAASLKAFGFELNGAFDLCSAFSAFY